MYVIPHVPFFVFHHHLSVAVRVIVDAAIHAQQHRVNVPSLSPHPPTTIC